VALTLGAVAVGLVAVLTPLGNIFGFGSLPPAFYVFLDGTVAAYLLLVETVKRLHYRGLQHASPHLRSI
jgi:Mg2+-importing ATPase